ncbi:MAG: VCBS repeat-containing protein, partial [Phycisphaerales bacterium]
EHDRYDCHGDVMGLAQTVPIVRPARAARAALRLALCVVVSACPSAPAKTRFRSSQIEGKGSEILFSDVDGDHLKDVLLIDEPNVVVFYHDAQKGFSTKSDIVYGLGDAPSAVWPAQLGADAESLLVMTVDGVAVVNFVQRNAPPVREQIIAHRTIIPGSLETPAVHYFPLSAKADNHPPSILVPAENGLQIWQHKNGWQCVQSLEDFLSRTILAFEEGPGYDTTIRLNMNVGDANGDGRDDIIVRRLEGPSETFAVHLQEQDGLFAVEPTLSWAGQWDWSWSCWVDINKDKNIDLIRSKWLYEPWFLPGTRTGKVLVRIYVADEKGRIPAEPQQVFRKNDWTDSIPIVDLDDDGHVDLVLGYSRFDTREGFRKAFIAKQLDFNLRFHFYRPGIGYPEKPDFQRDLAIHLDRHSIDMNWGRRRYFKRFVDLSGDFDGDGDLDLLVRDTADRVSVYSFVSRQVGFDRKPAVTFDHTEPVESFIIGDLNDDGISDLTMKLRNRNAFKIFVSRAQQGDIR